MSAIFVLALGVSLLQKPAEQPLTEKQLLAVEQRVEALQKEFRDNAILLEERLTAAVHQAEHREGRVVELHTRVVRVDDDRVHVRFFEELGDKRGPIVEFVTKRDGEFVGGTKNSAFVVGPTALPRSLAQTLRKDDLLRIRGTLVSIGLSAREERFEQNRTTPQRAVKAVVAAPRISKVDAPAPVVPVPAPPLVVPPPKPLPPPPLPLRPPVPPLPRP